MAVGEKKMIRDVARYYSYTRTSAEGVKTRVFKNSKAEAVEAHAKHLARTRSKSGASAREHALASRISKKVVEQAHAHVASGARKYGIPSQFIAVATRYFTRNNLKKSDLDTKTAMNHLKTYFSSHPRMGHDIDYYVSAVRHAYPKRFTGVRVKKAVREGKDPRSTTGQKRKPSAYAVFVGKKMKAGMTMADAAEEWSSTHKKAVPKKKAGAAKKAAPKAGAAKKAAPKKKAKTE